MAIDVRVPGSALNQNKFVVFGSKDPKEVSKKRAFYDWLGNYANIINERRFDLIKEYNTKGKTLEEKGKILQDIDDAEKALNTMKELYQTLSVELGISEEESVIGEDVKSVDMVQSQKYIEGLIANARACFADYMMKKFTKPDKSKVDMHNSYEASEFNKKDLAYEHEVNGVKSKYNERALLANVLIKEHYKMAQDKGLKKAKVSFSVDSLPCTNTFLSDEDELNYFNRNIAKNEKQIYDELYKKYEQLFEQSKINPKAYSSKLKKAEELLEMQKNNLLELQKGKKRYQAILSGGQLDRFL